MDPCSSNPVHSDCLQLHQPVGRKHIEVRGTSIRSASKCMRSSMAVCVALRHVPLPSCDRVKMCLQPWNVCIRQVTDAWQQQMHVLFLQEVLAPAPCWAAATERIMEAARELLGRRRYPTIFCGKSIV
jgi:hypothetical protein